MIDEKKIERTANLVFGVTDNNPSIEKAAFIVGAQWAQKEFIKSLWYAPVVEAEPRRDIIAISKKGMVYAFNFEYDDDWRQTFRDCNIERFCYLDDILPKEEL